MPTGACGINCDTCGLNSEGICSSCGNGTGEQARLKIEAQERLLGASCPILACARLNRLDYCMRDCDQFPCENFSSDGVSGYPFSKGFLDMQQRRRDQIGQTGQTDDLVIIPDQHWLEIDRKGLGILSRHSGAVLSESGTLLIDVMNRNVRVDPRLKVVEIQKHGKWMTAPSLLAFVTVLYLASSRSVPLTGSWVTEKDLSCSEFFKGIHQLRTKSALQRFGNDPQALIEAASAMGGIQTADVGDAAVRFWAFPAIPMKLILWCGDDELDPALTVMFDQSIDNLLAGDGIWALVQLVCETLVEHAP